MRSGKDLEKALNGKRSRLKKGRGMNSADKLWQLKKLEYKRDEILDRVKLYQMLRRNSITYDEFSDVGKKREEVEDYTLRIAELYKEASPFNAQISKLLEDG
jgi:hypothetical protein